MTPSPTPAGPSCSLIAGMPRLGMAAVAPTVPEGALSSPTPCIKVTSWSSVIRFNNLSAWPLAWESGSGENDDLAQVVVADPEVVPVAAALPGWRASPSQTAAADCDHCSASGSLHSFPVLCRVLA